MTRWTVYGAGKRHRHRELSLAVATLAAHHNANQPARITNDGVTWWHLHHTEGAWSFAMHHATPDLFTTHDTGQPAWAERAIDIYLSITNQPQPQPQPQAHQRDPCGS
jgi:hypothetical protein